MRCEQPGCGRDKVWSAPGLGVEPAWTCPATTEEHRLCARVAELEAKLAEEWISPLDKPMPVMKSMLIAILVRNTDTGAQWVEQFGCFLHDEDYGLFDLAGRDPLPWEPDSVLLYHLLPEVSDATLAREASRKKGAEHGE